jgi:hypothetical protein
MLSKDIQLPVTADEPDERDGSIWNIADRRQTKFGSRVNWGISSLLNNLERCLAFKVAISMVLVVKELEVFGLGSELAITAKPLPLKESSVVGVIEALHNAITPRFSDRDEDHLDAQRKAQSEDDAKRARVTIASTKTELVVDLEEVWDPNSLPTADQSQGHACRNSWELIKTR